MTAEPTPPPPATPSSLPSGWVRVDCHLHTVDSGDSATTVEDLERRIEEVGLTVVCVTDHHAITAAERAIERNVGARVVIGEEVRTSVGELIGLFLTERIPYVLPVGEVISRIRAQGGVVYAPHPYDPIRSALRQQLDRLCTEGHIDVVEAFNAKTAQAVYNDKAADVARQFELPVAAGSDAHDPAGIGAAYIEMPEFDGPKDFVEKLWEGRIFGEYRDHAARFVQSTQVS